MEWTTTNTNGVKHWVTVGMTDNDELLLVSITRTKLNGGAMTTIKHVTEGTIGVAELVRKVNNIAELDDEMFGMLSEHSRAE